MEQLLTQKTLWEDFSPDAEPLEINLIKDSVDGNILTRQVYFTGRTFSTGERTRVYAKICRKIGKGVKSAVLVTGDYKKPIDDEVLLSLAKQGFIAMAIDYAGRCDKGLHTLYCSKTEYCNADVAPSMFTVNETAKKTKLYEYALDTMRAVTYLQENEQASRISLLAASRGVYVGIIALGVDKRLASGVIMFEDLYKADPKTDDNDKVDLSDDDELNEHLEQSAEWQRYTQALSPQAYTMQINIPLYIINSANSFNVDLVEANQIQVRMNDVSRALIIPDAIDYLPKRYSSCVVNWLKGGAEPQNIELSSYCDEKGEYFLKLNAECAEADASIWYCVDRSRSARFWRKAQLTKIDGGFGGKVDLYDKVTDILAFGMVFGDIAVSTPLFKEKVETDSPKVANNIIFSGSDKQEMIFANTQGQWWNVDNTIKLAKGYLEIVGMKGKSLATFALNDKSKNRNLALTVSFDVCCKARQKLNVSAVCRFGDTNDTYSQSAMLIGDGKWQRITVEGKKFRRVGDGKALSEGDDVELLIIDAEEDFIVNNVCIV